MITWRDYLIEASRRREMLDEAVRERRHQHIHGESSRPTGWLQAWVVRVGAGLENLGCRMQSRYSPKADHSVNFKPATGKVVGGC